MTKTQWHNIPDRVKQQKTNPRFVKGKAKLWCIQNGIEIPGNKSLKDMGDGSVAKDPGKDGPKNSGDKGGEKELSRGGEFESPGRGSTGARDAWMEFREAVDSGKWHFTCHVVECVGFDREFYAKLRDRRTATGENETVEVEGEPQDISFEFTEE